MLDEAFRRASRSGYVDLLRIADCFDASASWPETATSREHLLLSRPTWERGAAKKVKIGSLPQEACAGAHAPPRWDACSARVFGCGLRTVRSRMLTVQLFHSSRAWKMRRPPAGLMTVAGTPAVTGVPEPRNRRRLSVSARRPGAYPQHSAARRDPVGGRRVTVPGRAPLGLI